MTSALWRKSLRSLEIESLAISFLNSYLAPDHEKLAAAELRRLLPDVFVTTGTELTREWHEFERTATAAANAYVGPQVSKYVAEFDAGLREQRLQRLAADDGIAWRSDLR